VRSYGRFVQISSRRSLSGRRRASAVGRLAAGHGPEAARTVVEVHRRRAYGPVDRTGRVVDSSSDSPAQPSTTWSPLERVWLHLQTGHHAQQGRFRG
jgi:hypothetical protein